MVIFLERGADLHVARLMSLLLTVSCFSKIQLTWVVLDKGCVSDIGVPVLSLSLYLECKLVYSCGFMGMGILGRICFSLFLLLGFSRSFSGLFL